MNDVSARSQCVEKDWKQPEQPLFRAVTGLPSSLTPSFPVGIEKCFCPPPQNPRENLTKPVNYRLNHNFDQNHAGYVGGDR
jgi:hypothetical protein